MISLVYDVLFGYTGFFSLEEHCVEIIESEAGKESFELALWNTKWLLMRFNHLRSRHPV